MMTNASTRIFTEKYSAAPCSALELICSTGSLVELRAAVDNGADWVKLDIRSGHFGGFGFDNAGMRKGIRYAHDRQCKVLVSTDGNPLESDWRARREIVDSAANFGADGFLFSDPALMLYAAANYPELQLHYAIEEGALNRESLDFYRRQFGASRILLPRILSLSTLEKLGNAIGEGFVVFGFGKLVTAGLQQKGQAERQHQAGAFSITSPALGMAMDTPPVSSMLERCATDASSANDQCYGVGGSLDLNALRFLPQLSTSGVRAIVVDAPPHAPLYLVQMTRVWREAIDDCLENVDHYQVRQSWIAKLDEQSRDTSRSHLAVSSTGRFQALSSRR
jgi:collagenase-like PrtC family protease